MEESRDTQPYPERQYSAHAAAAYDKDSKVIEFFNRSSGHAQTEWDEFFGPPVVKGTVKVHGWKLDKGKQIGAQGGVNRRLQSQQQLPSPPAAMPHPQGAAGNPAIAMPPQSALYPQQQQQAVPLQRGPSGAPPLPQGWERRVDPSGKVFFIDHINKRTSWVHPVTGQPDPSMPSLPGQVPFDAPNNRTPAQPQRSPVAAGPSAPAQAPPVPGGNPRTSNPLDNFDEPPLPQGWEKRYDPGTGRPFFVDHVNRQTSWVHPVTGRPGLPAPARSPPPAANPDREEQPKEDTQSRPQLPLHEKVDSDVEMNTNSQQPQQ